MAITKEKGKIDGWIVRVPYAARVIIQYSAHLAVSEEGLICAFELWVRESPWF